MDVFKVVALERKGCGCGVDVAEYVGELLLELDFQVDVKSHVNGLEGAVRLNADAAA